ncbi:Putative oxidoreductase [[Actinomadura] parvosata subsp. kistnae]|nr:Putative oxidoreductase [Actinomadura parvosata subsp. kistnae]
MDHVNLGHSGLRVSRACLGTMNFGTEHGLAASDEAEAGRIIDAFAEAGGNFIDTADLYHRGETEEIVGRALKGRREWMVLATKGAMPVGTEGRGLSRRHLTRALDASLRRLGTDYIDLYQCHQWDPSTPIEETMATLDGFVKAGKVRYLGCSNFTATQIVEAQWAAARVGGTPLVSLQPQYSLVQRVIEAEILSACERHGLGVVAYGTLGAACWPAATGAARPPTPAAAWAGSSATPCPARTGGPSPCSPSATWRSPRPSPRSRPSSAPHRPRSRWPGSRAAPG